MRLRFVMAIALVVCAAPVAWGQLRQEINLSGEWEYVRVEELDTPPDEGWQPVHVPGLIHRVDYQRAWFRRDFEVPDVGPGVRIVLHFGGVKFNSTVRVNGQTVGGHYGGHEPFDVDITGAAKLGETNRVEVGCHDWTGVFIDNETDFSTMQEKPTRSRGIPQDKILAPIGGHNEMFGLWDDVKLRTHRTMHVSDLFIKPSVRDGALRVDYEIGNANVASSDIAVDVDVLDGDEVVLSKTQAAVVKPGGVAAQVTIPWDDPRHWTPDDPHLYVLRTRLRMGDVALDELRTRFGFREFWVDGKNFYLNGARVNLPATSWWPSTGAETKAEIQDKIRRIKEANCVCFRTHTQPWREIWYETADEMGLMMIPEGAIWNDDYAYRIDDPIFWDNYAAHLKAMVDRDKNKPSVIMYSLENEMYGGRLNDEAPAKKDLARMGELMHQWDPTRPIMYESDGDPLGVADVVGVHYPHEYPTFTKWPNTAYWMDEPINIGHQFLNGEETWLWDRQKPVYVGEFLWIPSSDPSWHTVFYGDDAYLGYRKYRVMAKAESWRMAIQAYRYYEIGGISPWTMVEGGPLEEERNAMYAAQKYAMQPVAAFVREYDHNFYSGDQVVRTADVYNDTLSPGTLSLGWTLTAGEETVCTGREDIHLGPAERKETRFTLQMPTVGERQSATLTVNIERDGKQVFTDSKAYSVFPPLSLKAPEAAVIGIYDPQGATRTALANRGINLAPVPDLNAIPASTQGVIIGDGALESVAARAPVIGAEAGAARGLLDYVRAGGCVLVLRQDAYPQGLLPSNLTAHSSTMTFPQMPGHPLLSGVTAEDLKWWRPDNVVTGLEPPRPVQGSYKAVVVSGSRAGIAHAPLLELPMGRGTIVLCQMRLIERLGVEPVAETLLQNALDYLAGFESSAGRTALYCENPETRQYLSGIGLAAEDITGDPTGADWRGFDLLIACSPLDGLGPCGDRIQELVARGGSVLMHDVTPEEWQAVNVTLGTDLQLVKQEGSATRVPGADALSEFFANEDLYWLGTVRAAHSWATKPLASDMTRFVFSKTLQGKNVTEYPHTLMTVTGAHTKITETSASIPSGGSSATVPITVPQDGPYIVGVVAGGTQADGIWPAGAVEVDGEPFGTFACARGEFDTYTMFGPLTKGAHELTVRFTNDAYNPPNDRNLAVKSVLVAEDTPMPGVKLLTSPAALAVIERGGGRVIVDNINWDTTQTNSTKAARYICGLLTGLGAQFTQADATVIEAETFEPAPTMNWFRFDPGAAYLGDSGYIESNVRCAKAGAYVFNIVARGTSVAGIYPIIAVEINGEHVGDVELKTDGWRRYPIAVELDEGENGVRLTFTNDEWDPPEDRNLSVDKIEVTPAP